MWDHQLILLHLFVYLMFSQYFNKYYIHIYDEYFNMLNKQLLYEKMMIDISKLVKKQLYEMARKSVNRTIDKKLWLTVSSIISRNRSTEAENIKPIGTDKDNLLQRYVAALLIMKKPCPNNVSEIEDLKTFKNIGNKFIELGGTISEIRELYNKNNSDITISNNTEHDITDKKDEDIKQDINNDNKSSFFDDMFDEQDDEYNDSLLGDISDTDDSTQNLMMDTLVSVDNKTSLDKAWYIVMHDANKPKGFKLVKPKNINEYQKYVYIPTKRGHKAGQELYKKLCKEGWKEYRGLGMTCGDYSKQQADNYQKSHEWWSYYDMSISVYLEKENSIIPVQLNANSTYDDIISQLSNIDKDIVQHAEDNKRYYKEMIDIYKNNISNIDNKLIKDIISKDSFYEYILVSPDGGLMLSKYTEIDHTKWDYNDTYAYNETNYINIYNGKYDKFGHMNHIFYKSNRSIKTTYILTFTGAVNYNQQLSDKTLDVQHTSDTEYNNKLKKAKAAFRKCLDKYGYNLMYVLGWERENHKWSFDRNDILQVEVITPYVGYNDCDNLENYFWGRKPKSKILKTSRKNVPQYIKITTKEAQQKDPNIIAQVSDVNERIRCTQYNIGNNNYHLIVTLDNDGITDYKNFLQK